MSSAPRVERPRTGPTVRTSARPADAVEPTGSRDLVASSPAPLGPSGSLGLYSVVGVVSALAAAVVAIWVRPPFPWVTLGLVVVLVAFLEARGSVPIKVGRSRIAFSAKAYASIGAVYLLGPPAAVASAIASLATEVSVKRQISVKPLFNAAMGILVYGAAFGTFDGLRSLAGSNIFLLVVAGACGGCAAWIVNHILVGSVIAAEQGFRHFRLWAYASNVTSLFPYYLGYGLTGVGVVAASARIHEVAALVTLGAPVAIVQTATNRWIREQNARLLEARTGFNATLVSLSKAIDLRDKDTEGHCRRVVQYSLSMGKQLNFEEEDLIRLCHGALLHDIGKIGVSDTILHKPGPLTDEEWAIMRTHPQLGFMMVADVDQLEKAREIILNHHERFDGKGYPNGISGQLIPLAARLFTIADSFDAMISDRPYRKGMSIAAARREVRRCSGTQFDPLCVDAFDKITDEELEAIAQEREHPTIEMLSF